MGLQEQWIVVQKGLIKLKCKTVASSGVFPPYPPPPLKKWSKQKFHLKLLEFVNKWLSL